MSKTLEIVTELGSDRNSRAYLEMLNNGELNFFFGWWVAISKGVLIATAESELDARNHEAVSRVEGTVLIHEVHRPIVFH